MHTVYPPVSTLEVAVAQEVAMAIRSLRKNLQEVLSDNAPSEDSGQGLESLDISEQLSGHALTELLLVIQRPERHGLDGLGLGCSDER